MPRSFLPSKNIAQDRTLLLLCRSLLGTNITLELNNDTQCSGLLVDVETDFMSKNTRLILQNVSTMSVFDTFDAFLDPSEQQNNQTTSQTAIPSQPTSIDQFVQHLPPNIDLTLPYLVSDQAFEIFSSTTFQNMSPEEKLNTITALRNQYDAMHISQHQNHENNDKRVETTPILLKNVLYVHLPPKCQPIGYMTGYVNKLQRQQFQEMKGKVGRRQFIEDQIVSQIETHKKQKTLANTDGP